MWCNQIFSLIDAEGVIKNIIVADNYELAARLAVATLGEGACAFDTTLYPVHIGDKYADGVFTSAESGSEIPRNPTEAEQIASLRCQVSAQESDLNDLYEYAADSIYTDCLAEIGIDDSAEGEGV